MPGERTKEFEGYRSDIYKDTVGKRTIGYGFNIDDPYISQFIPEDVVSGKRPISKEESESVFETLYKKAREDARKFLGSDTYDRLPPELKDTMDDLSYNMGLNTLSQFKKFKAALKEGDTQKAAEELKNSKWFEQTGRRSRYHYEKMKKSPSLDLSFLNPFHIEEAEAAEPKEKESKENDLVTGLKQWYMDRKGNTQQQPQEQPKEGQSDLVNELRAWYKQRKQLTPQQRVAPKREPLSDAELIEGGTKLMEAWTGVPKQFWNPEAYQPTPETRPLTLKDAVNDMKKLGQGVLLGAHALYEPVERAIHYPIATVLNRVVQEGKPFWRSLWEGTEGLRQFKHNPERLKTMFSVMHEYQKDLNQMYGMPENYTAPGDQVWEIVGGMASRFLLPDMISLGKSAIKGVGKATYQEAMKTIQAGKEASIEALEKLANTIDDAKDFNALIRYTKSKLPPAQAKEIIRGLNEVRNVIKNDPVHGAKAAPAYSAAPAVIPGAPARVSAPAGKVSDLFRPRNENVLMGNVDLKPAQYPGIAKPVIPTVPPVTRVALPPGTPVVDIKGQRGVVKAAEPLDPSEGIQFYRVDFGPQAPNALMSEGILSPLTAPQAQGDTATVRPDTVRPISMVRPDTSQTGATEPLNTLHNLKRYIKRSSRGSNLSAEEQEQLDALPEGGSVVIRNVHVTRRPETVSTYDVQLTQPVQRVAKKEFKVKDKTGPRYRMFDRNGQEIDLLKKEKNKFQPEFKSILYKDTWIRFQRDDGTEEFGEIQSIKPDQIVVMVPDGTTEIVPPQSVQVVQEFNIPDREELLPQRYVSKETKALQPPTVISKMINSGKINAKDLYKRISKRIRKMEIGKGDEAKDIEDIAKINNSIPSQFIEDLTQDVLADLIKNQVYDAAQPLDKWLNSKIYWLVKDHLIRKTVSPEFGQTKYTKSWLTKGSKKSIEAVAANLMNQGKKPTLELIAKELGITVPELQNLRAASQKGPMQGKAGRKMPVLSPEELEVYAGLPVPKEFRETVGRAGLWLKESWQKPPEYVEDMDKLIKVWFGNEIKANMIAQWAMEDVIKAVPEETRRILIATTIQHPEMVSQLSPVEQGVRKFIKDEYDAKLKWANENGLKIHFRENYVTHIYKDKIEKVKNILYPIGGKLGTKFRFARARKFNTFEEAEAAGLTPIKDIAILYSTYLRQLFRTVDNMQLIQGVKQLKDKDGTPLLMRADQAPPNYRIVDEPAFDRYMYVGETYERKTPLLYKMPIKAHPLIAKTLSQLVRPLIPYNEGMKLLAKARGLVKRFIMYNVLVHGWNVETQIGNQMQWNLAKLIPEYKKAAQMVKNHDEKLLLMAERGVNLEGFWNFNNELYARIQGHPSIEKTWGEVKTLPEVLQKIIDINDRLLWGGIVKFTQVAMWDNTVARNLKYGPALSVKEAEELAADQINTLIGTLPEHIFSGLEKEFLNWTLFARNWTVSNIRQITGALGLGSRGPIRFIGWRGLNKEQIKTNQKFFINYILREIVYFLASSQMLQWFFQIIHGKRPCWMWDNEETHKFDIDLGFNDKRGRPVYLVHWLFRDIRDQIAWVTDPPRTMINKMEPILKSSAESIVNIRFWDRKPVSESPGLKGALERIGHIFKNVSPWRNVYQIAGGPAEEGVLRTWQERLIMLSGTWTRHGLVYPAHVYDMMSYRDKAEFILELTPKERRELKSLLEKGLINGTMAHRFMAFRQKRNLDRKKLNEQWNILTQQDKIGQGMQLLEKEGLGRTSQKNRLKEYMQRRLNR